MYICIMYVHVQYKAFQVCAECNYDLLLLQRQEEKRGRKFKENGGKGVKVLK